MQDTNNKMVNIFTYVSQHTHRRLSVLAAENGLDKKIVYRLALDFAVAHINPLNIGCTFDQFARAYTLERNKDDFDYPLELPDLIDDVPF